MSMQELIEHEKTADATVEAMPYWKLPLRVVLTGYYSLINQMIYGPIDGTDRTSVDAGEAVASRLSHLSKFFSRCPPEPIHTAVDCMSLFAAADPGFAHSRELLSYAHFCELMPEARKKHYLVTRRAGGFDLTHPSAAFTEAETKDILLSELALGHRERVPPKVALRTALLSGWLKVHPAARRYFPRLYVDVMAEFYEYAYRSVVEPPILTDAGFRSAVGCGFEDFLRFRSAMVAMADFCHAMGAWHRGKLQKGNSSQEVTHEYGEWVSICWEKDYFFNSIRQMAGLSQEQCEVLLGIYGIDLAAAAPVVEHARDGFFPPIWCLPNHVLFSPDVLSRTVSSRNLAFVLNRLEKKKFDDLVSDHLEPQLIQTAVDILAGAGGGVECVLNIPWSVGPVKGQIDLLVYFPAANVVWHVQAKGALPPHGARMVAALEERVEEALTQLSRFHNLPHAEQHRIFSSKLGRNVAPARVVEVVLLRACAGTARVWGQKGNRVFLTLPVLVELVNQARSQGSLALLVDCANSVDSIISRYVTDMSPRWEQGSITVAGEEITMPLLKFDLDKVEERRKRLWEGTAVGRGSGNPWKVVAPPGSNVVVVPAGSIPKPPQTQEDQLRRALRLMDEHPDWEEKQFGKRSGLHIRTLREHPLTRPVLELLKRRRKKRGKC